MFQSFFILNPLEQFELANILVFQNLIIFSNSHISIVFVTFLRFLAFNFIENKEGSKWCSSFYRTLLCEIFINIPMDILINFGGYKVLKKGLFFIIVTLFTFICFCNVSSAVPYSFSVTSHIIVTFSLSFTVFLSVNFFAIKNFGKKYFLIFLPSGISLVIAPFLIIIEVISYFFRVISLSVRLFANLMSGHTLLAVLNSFSWIAVLTPVFPFTTITIAITGLLYFLEIGVAFIQAYVFTLLSTLYLFEAFQINH
jgi:ATP synthase subunit 6